jgi:hypothetical protein
MAQRPYKKGKTRGQVDIFPPNLDEYISMNNPVRANDAVERAALRSSVMQKSLFFVDNHKERQL